MFTWQLNKPTINGNIKYIIQKNLITHTEKHQSILSKTVYFIVYLLLVYSLPINASHLKKICEQLEMSDEQCCIADKVMQALGYGGLAVAVSTYGVPFVLAKLGFAATGVTGGSFAAWWQATNVAPGLFSWFQSVSMTGHLAGLATKLGVTAASAKSYFSSCDIETKSDSENCKKNKKCD